MQCDFQSIKRECGAGNGDQGVSPGASARGCYASPMLAARLWERIEAYQVFVK
jgi:hypothetical protein